MTQSDAADAGALARVILALHIDPEHNAAAMVAQPGRSYRRRMR